MNETATTNHTIKSLLYWRKSKVNGLACVPVILTLTADKKLSMKTADGVEQFNTAAADMQVKFTGWGTMVVTVAGKQYDIVGAGASVSPSPTPEQVEEVRAAQQVGPMTGAGVTRTGAGGTAAGIAAGGAAGAAAGVAGAAAMQYAFQQGVNTLKDWQDQLAAAGAKVTKSSMKYMTYYIVGFVLLLVIFWAIGTYNK